MITSVAKMTNARCYLFCVEKNDIHVFSMVQTCKVIDEEIVFD